mmetsp:Transcript_23349/g.44782  ORF Transcript_23349/g.44782 Transcript_23349/m.44782 type:complete len:357 (-) Transcript_23349:70-1140(-)
MRQHSTGPTVSGVAAVQQPPLFERLLIAAPAQAATATTAAPPKRPAAGLTVQHGANPRAVDVASLIVSTAAPQRPVATVASTGSSATLSATSALTVIGREVSIGSAGERDQRSGPLSPTQLHPFAESPLSPLPAVSPAAAAAAAVAATAATMAAGALTASAAHLGQTPMAALSAFMPLPSPLWGPDDLLALGEASPRTPRRSLVYTPTPSSGMVTMTSVATPLRTPTSNCTPSRQLLSPSTPRTPWATALGMGASSPATAPACCSHRIASVSQTVPRIFGAAEGRAASCTDRRLSAVWAAAGLSGTTRTRLAEWHHLYFEEVGREPSDPNQFRSFVVNRGGQLPWSIARRCLTPPC